MSNTGEGQGENLGKMVPWQIREFPETLRDAITEQARKESVKVGELLTRLIIEANAAGWTFRKFDRFANPSNGADPARVRALFDMAADLGRAGVAVQKGTAAQLNRLLKRELASELGTGKGRAPAPALPAPDPEA